MKRFRTWMGLAVAVIGVGWGEAGAGDLDSFDILNFDPSIDGIHYFTVTSARTLAARQFTVGANLDYSRNPLQQQNMSSGAIGPQTSNLLVLNLLWAYGITPWWNVGLGVPVVPLQSYTPLGNPGAGKESKNWLGDVRLESKLRLLDLDEYTFGIAMVPFVTFPTGESQIRQAGGTVVNNYLGNGSPTGGARLVLESHPADPLVLAVNVGYTLHKNVNPGGLTFNLDDVISYGFGANARLNDWLHFVTEVTGYTAAKDFLGNEYSSPVEGGAGFQVHIPITKGKMIASLGSNLGLDSGYGTPDWRTHLGVSYSMGGADEGKIAVDIQPGEALYAVLQGDKIIITEPVVFDARNKIRPVSETALDDIVEIMKGNSHIRMLRIEGHLDPASSEEEDLKISRWRANEVRDYLIIRGVDPDRLVAIGYGSTRPIAANDTEVGRSRNRRIEFVIVRRTGAKR